MSAVSSESPRAGADLAEAERKHSTDAAVPDHPSDGPPDGPPAAKDFGRFRMYRLRAGTVSGG